MAQKHSNLILTLVVFLVLLGCMSEEDKQPIKEDPVELPPCYEGSVLVNFEDGCSDVDYPDLETSIYVLPYPPGSAYPTGLTNCSSSFHAEGNGDEYAFDFNMPNDTDFHAIRAGTVIKLRENHPNSGNGTAGNYVHIQHDDNTFALYYHSPPNGIFVEVGDEVEQGQRLGKTGTSGYAGYPHLHLIVVQENTDFPFNGIPISFRNVYPRHTVLKSNFESYAACEY